MLHLAKTLGETKVLDYGCGKCTLGEQLPMLDVTNYDPAIPQHAVMPEPHPVVVCTDVLEHIEPDKLDNVLSHLHSLTIKGVYLEVSTVPAKKFLADGRNAHLIIQPVEMWLPLLNRYFKPIGLLTGFNSFTYTGITYGFWKAIQNSPPPPPPKPDISQAVIGFQA